MHWIYLAPHLDDAVYSCGGLIWEQTQAGQKVEIWTICAGDPPPGPLSSFAEALHARWKTGGEAGAVRRVEDQQAAARLGAHIRHLALPDCIYRRHPVSGEALYASEGAIFGEVHPAEDGLVAWLRTLLTEQILAETRVVAPLTVGGHVDHRLVREAFEQTGRAGRYYADYPYAAQNARVADRVPAGWTADIFPVSERGFNAWGEAVALYASQLSSFWANRAVMEGALRDYLQEVGGIRLWRPEFGVTPK